MSGADFTNQWRVLTQAAAQANQTGQQRKPGENSVKAVFTLDKQKVANMNALIQNVTVKGEHFAQIRDADQ